MLRFTAVYIGCRNFGCQQHPNSSVEGKLPGLENEVQLEDRLKVFPALPEPHGPSALTSEIGTLNIASRGHVSDTVASLLQTTSLKP